MSGSYFPDLLGRMSPDRVQVFGAALTNISKPVADDLQESRVSILPLPPLTTHLQLPVIALRLAGLIRQNDIDVLHLHNFDAALVGVMSSRLGSTPITVVTRHHSDAHHLLAKRWHIRIDRAVASLAHGVIANSRSTRDVIVNAEGISPSKVRVIYNGIVPERFQSVSAADALRLRRDLGIADRFVVTVPARLYELKGHAYLIAALPQILQAVGPGFVVLFVGSGPEEAQLRDSVSRLGLDEHVRFLGHRPDMPHVLAGSDLMALPSLTEPFGIVVVEGMAAGKAVVATKVGGIPELVDHGRTGLLVPPRSSAALADSIIALVRDPDLRAAMGAEGAKRAGRFTIDRKSVV